MEEGDVFGNKHLSEVSYGELMSFLEEGREEGVRLDYKESWTERITETAAAFANTYGGYILYGVKEIDQNNRPDQPDPQNIPGIDFSRGAPVASLRSKILDNTRPPVELEIKPVPLEGSEELGVLIVGIEESMDAPHEVLVPGATRIPVRWADQTVPASLDEIEWLINRRESQRSERKKPLNVQFFSGRFASAPDGSGYQRFPPVVGVAVRPRKMVSLGFTFDATLDKKLRSWGAPVAPYHDEGQLLLPMAVELRS